MMNRAGSLVLALCALVAPTQVVAAAESPATRPASANAHGPLPERADVAPFLQPLIDGEWCRGVVVGVVTPDGSRVFGFGRASDHDARVPDGDTVFEIGSVTKVFTAVLLADLAREGRLSLDDPVQPLLPAEAKVPQRDGKVITLGQLAAHTSGLPRMPANFRPADPDNPYADYDAARLYAFLAALRLARDPGERYEYSNVGAGLLGHALSLKAGRSYEALVLDRVCRPLGMRDTRLTLDDALRARLAPGHDADGNPVSNWDLNALAGAGGLRSTVNDLLKFAAAHAGVSEASTTTTATTRGGAAAGLPAGVPRSLADAIAMTHARRADATPGMGVALGWHVHDGLGFLVHSGQTGGYHSCVVVSPRHRAGVVVLTNSATGAVDDPALRLARLATGEDVRPNPPPPTVAVAPAALDACAGTYLLGPLAVLTVTRDGDRLYAQLTGQPRFRIYPRSPTEFAWRVVDARVTFDVRADGKATRAVLHQNGRDVPGLRVTIPTTLPATGE